MPKNTLTNVVLGALVVALTGCSGGATVEPQRTVQITVPGSGLSVVATISSGSLGEECGGGGCQSSNMQTPTRRGTSP